MEIKSNTVPDSPTIAILDLNGELDASNYLDVIDHVRDLYKAGARQLVIDLSDVTFLSSSGLVSLHSAALVMRGEEPPSPDLGWSAFTPSPPTWSRGSSIAARWSTPRVGYAKRWR